MSLAASSQPSRAEILRVKIHTSRNRNRIDVGLENNGENRVEIRLHARHGTARSRHIGCVCRRRPGRCAATGRYPADGALLSERTRWAAEYGPTNNQHPGAALAALSLKAQVLANEPPGGEQAERAGRESQTDESSSGVNAQRIGDDGDEAKKPSRTGNDSLVLFGSRAEDAGLS